MDSSLIIGGKIRLLLTDCRACKMIFLDSVQL